MKLEGKDTNFVDKLCRSCLGEVGVVAHEAPREMRSNIFAMFDRNKGVTLIELLIALVMSSILIAGLYRVFISQQKTYTVQEQVIDMQQNMRFAIYRMMSEIRMAGFGNVIMVLPVQFTTSGQMRNFNHILNPDKPVAGSLTIVSAIGEGAAIIEIPASNQIKVSSLSHFDKGKKKYISIGGIESHIIIDIDTEDKKITLNRNIIYSHAIGTPVFPIRAISYQVVKENDMYILKRDENIGGGRQPLAENIENVQFEYFDDQGIPTADPSNIQMVKVTVTARTKMADSDFKGGNGFRRRQIASNINIRNRDLSP
jgi:prepilin-type N-terminal cleavage/methylation domain-containing protein